MKDDPNKRITAALSREWAEYQERERQRRLWVGIRRAGAIALVLALAVGMMLYLSSRLS